MVAAEHDHLPPKRSCLLIKLVSNIHEHFILLQVSCQTLYKYSFIKLHSTQCSRCCGYPHFTDEEVQRGWVTCPEARSKDAGRPGTTHRPPDYSPVILPTRANTTPPTLSFMLLKCVCLLCFRSSKLVKRIMASDLFPASGSCALIGIAQNRNGNPDLD